MRQPRRLTPRAVSLAFGAAACFALAALLEAAQAVRGVAGSGVTALGFFAATVLWLGVAWRWRKRLDESDTNA